MGAKSYHFENNKITKFKGFSNHKDWNSEYNLGNINKKEVLSGVSILIVDDSSINQIVAQKILQSFGASVRMVCDGKLGLTSFFEEDFDLILMDLEMSEVDGYEATALIKNTERYQNRKIPILAYTSYSLEEVEKSMQKAGMDGYVEKPFTQEKAWHSVVPFVKNKFIKSRQA